MFLRYIFGILIALVLAACTNKPTAEMPSDPAAKVNPKAAPINTQLGLTYLEEGQIDRARRKLLIALIQGPHYQPAYEAMGYFLEKTGRAEEARAYYLKSLAMDASHGSSQNNYGTYLCRQKDYRAAIQHFMLAVRDPNYLTPADAYENAGFCAELIPNSEEAAHYFKLALEQDSNRPRSSLALAQINFSHGNYKEAYKYLENYDKLAPHSAESLWLSVQLNKKLGYFDKASSSAILLRNAFPKSKESKQLKE